MSEQQNAPGDWRATERMVDAAMKSARYIASPEDSLVVEREVIRAVVDAALEESRTLRLPPVGARAPQAPPTMIGPGDLPMREEIRQHSVDTWRRHSRDAKRALAGFSVAALILVAVFSLTIIETGPTQAMRSTAEADADWVGAAYWFEVLLWTRMSALGLAAGVVVMLIQAGRTVSVLRRIRAKQASAKEAADA